MAKHHSFLQEEKTLRVDGTILIGGNPAELNGGIGPENRTDQIDTLCPETSSRKSGREREALS